MRRRAKIDANQAEIIAALRRVGASVIDLAAVGGGCPDIQAGYKGINYNIEIKNGRAQKSDRVLTPAQVAFHRDWRGQICVVETVDEALAAIGIHKQSFLEHSL